MIILPLREYLKRKSEFENINNRFIKCVNKHNKSNTFLAVELREKPYVDDNGNEHIIPSHVNIRDMMLVNLFINSYGPCGIDDYVVEIDDITDAISKSYRVNLSSKDYVNMDEYELSDKMHWFNICVLKFLKNEHNHSVLLASDLNKAKKILRELTSRDNVPINYEKKLKKLFECLGIADEQFKKYMEGGITSWK